MEEEAAAGEQQAAAAAKVQPPHASSGSGTQAAVAAGCSPRRITAPPAWRERIQGHPPLNWSCCPLRGRSLPAAAAASWMGVAVAEKATLTASCPAGDSQQPLRNAVEVWAAGIESWSGSSSKSVARWEKERACSAEFMAPQLRHAPSIASSCACQRLRAASPATNSLPAQNPALHQPVALQPAAPARMAALCQGRGIAGG